MHVARFMLFLCLPCIARCALITCVACVACAGSLSLRLGQTICLVSHVCRAIACVSSSCHAMVHTCVEIMIGSAQTNLWSLRCGQTSSLCLRLQVESALRPDRLFWCTVMFHVVYGGVIASAQINLWSLCFGQTNSLVLRLQGWVSLRSGQTPCFAYLDFFVVVNFGMRMRQQTCVYVSAVVRASSATGRWRN